MSASIAKAGSRTHQSGTSTPKEHTSNASSHSGEPHLQPTHILPTSAAQTARHALPALQAAVFIFSFKGLVANPVATMWSTLPVLATIQAAYAFLCLPVAGSSRSSRKHRPGEKKKDTGGSNVIAATLLSLLLSLSITPFFHLAMLLFGAPVLTHPQHTLLCAAHLSVLTLFPLFYTHGVDPATWLAVAGFRAPFDETFGGLVGGVAGAWLGAVPIPLDWDREWQKWPVTILTGVYLGYFVGRTLVGTVLFGKRF